MNCVKCGYQLDTGLKCWSCGTQYKLIEESKTTEFINYPIAMPTTADDNYPKKEDIQLEY